MIEVDDRIINLIVTEPMVIDWSELIGVGVMAGLLGLFAFFVVKLQHK